MKTMKYILFLLASLSIGAVDAQNFSLNLIPLEIEELGGLQSFAFGHSHGEYLLIGGRLDGLHRRQPWASFDLAGHNDQITVVDPKNGEVWKHSISELPEILRDQLKSANICFDQKGDYLFLVGGYGYSEEVQNHITFPLLTIIHVPGMIEAVKRNSELQLQIQVIAHEKMAVTGGSLNRIHDEFYLIGGQKFIGHYNPMGPDHGPGFEQVYTNEIRKFRVEGSFPNFSLIMGESHHDRELLHRRDYNALEQILPGGRLGIIAFSGVFQEDIDLPFLNAVVIDSSKVLEAENFEQLYNHYHCPKVPLYSMDSQEMTTIFFGGIAQFYDQDGILVQDQNVPFVKTIAKVSMNQNGQLNEVKLEEEMPGFLGTGAEFLPLNNLPVSERGVLLFDELPDSTHIGYILGGISSSDRNIFWTNDGTQSNASDHLYELWLIKDQMTNTLDPIDRNKIEKDFQFIVYPNPNDGTIFFTFLTNEQADIEVQILDFQGKYLKNEFYQAMPPDKYGFEITLDETQMNEFIVIRLKINGQSASRKIIMTQ